MHLETAASSVRGAISTQEPIVCGQTLEKYYSFRVRDSEKGMRPPAAPWMHADTHK